MEGITNNQTVSATQLGLFESIADLLLIDPIFIFGIVNCCTLDVNMQKGR